MSNLVAHAKDELERAGLFREDSDYGGMLGDAVLKMVQQFADEGHSGFSAGMAVSLFERLARFEPLTPLTGADDEWTECEELNDKPMYQNKRCPHVFKEGDHAYDIEGRIFREPNGVCFTSNDSRVPVTFPYTPSREYIDVPGTEPK